jgi:RHS repeat-associated protein
MAEGLQTLKYRYTIHGWLKSINGEDVNDPSSTADNIFSMSLEYYQNDYIPASGSTGTYTGSASYVGSYTGNITAWRWKNRVDNPNVDGHWGYEYLYNERNELMTAQFGNIQTNSSGSNPSFATNLTDDYKVSGITYDNNGNITALNRRGENGAILDALTYNYYSGTNKLSKISDIFSSSGTGDIVNQGNNNYTYSEIGELTQDNSEDNKIIYDVYGKVIEVTTVANVTKAKYFYDGGGQRVKKETYNGTTVKTTWYIAGHIYERTGTGGELLHTEITISGGGRLGVAYTNVYNNSLDYHYELSDHLGNVRAVIRKAAPGSTNPIEIMSYADYFPFGWQMPGRNQQGDYRYAYQGQEKDPETGWEAFELRMYDGRVGRWMTMDPYGEFHSPYLAMGNSPVNLVDPDGGHTEDWIKIDGNYKYDSEITTPSEAIAKYGDGVEYIGKTGNFIAFNKRGVNLNIDGSWNYSNGENPISIIVNPPMEYNYSFAQSFGEFDNLLGIASGVQTQTSINLTRSSLRRGYSGLNSSTYGNELSPRQIKNLKFGPIRGQNVIRLSTSLRYFGNITAAYGYISITQDALNGRTSYPKAIVDYGVVTASWRGGAIGLAFGIGYGIGGPLIVATPGYQRWRTFTWLPIRYDLLGY